MDPAASRGRLAAGMRDRGESRDPVRCQDTKRARRANLAWGSDKEALRRSR